MRKFVVHWVSAWYTARSRSDWQSNLSCEPDTAIYHGKSQRAKLVLNLIIIIIGLELNACLPAIKTDCKTGTLWLVNEQHKICWLDLQTSREICFKQDGYYWFPRVSPDRKFVAYVYAPNKDTPYMTYITPIDPVSAYQPRAITPKTSSFISWSPDSRFIAFVFGDTKANMNVYVMDIGSDTFTQLTTEGYYTLVEWSPINHVLLAVRQLSLIENPAGTIFTLIDFQTKASSNISGIVNGDINPRWSRDGTQIMFASKRLSDHYYKLFALDLNSSKVSEILTGSQGEAFSDFLGIWSPENKNCIVFNRSEKTQTEIYIINLSTHEIEFIKKGVVFDWTD